MESDDAGNRLSQIRQVEQNYYHINFGYLLGIQIQNQNYINNLVVRIFIYYRKR